MFMYVCIVTIDNDDSLSIGVITGLVLGGYAVVVIIILLAIVVLIKRKKNKKYASKHNGFHECNGPSTTIRSIY